MIESLTISAVAVAFAVNVLSSLTKNYIYPRFGKFGVQLFAFILATIGAWFFLYGQHIAGFMHVVVAGLGVFTLAVTMYEVILSRLDWFKVTTPAVERARAEETTI